MLRASLAAAGWTPIDLPEANRSTIVSVPLGGIEPAHILAELKRRGVICAARDGSLRLAVRFYNHEEDVDRVATALSELRAAPP
jgi:selenocysteine lyase/cysteine desulfurase